MDVSWWLVTVFLLNLSAYVIAFWAAVDVLQQRREPMAMLSWLLSIFLLPLIGVPLYYLIGERKVRRRGRKKRKRQAPIAAALRGHGALEAGWAPLSPEVRRAGHMQESLHRLITLGQNMGALPVTTGNRVEVYVNAHETHEALLAAISKAKHHVHLEYYIFRGDATGKQFLELLIQKAKAGVEVRLLVDGIGSFATRWTFLRALSQAGGKVSTFLPAIPWRHPRHINCRNHRKIVVVDGEVAFTGSQNIGDEYRGRLKRLAPWKDTHVRIEGPAVRDVQEIFVEDWYFAAEEELTGPTYLRRPQPVGSSLVQIIPSGPDQDEGVLTHILFEAIAIASKSLRISTPYFVPDPGLVIALQNAAYRGVQVEILIPSRTDSRIVLWAGRSFYQEMLKAGIKIYEFEHGMLHSKTVCIDDLWTLISSANMDVRSFLLNFEVTASVVDEAVSNKLLEDFRASLARSVAIQRLEGRGPLLSTVLEGAARLLSPLL